MLQPQVHLDRCQVDPHLPLYTVGLADRGITLYKQQVRSLNLIYALKAENRLNGPIAVLGGGGAGATAALAAATLGCEVEIFEQRPTLFHFQQGCDTRWLHPHNYDWPAPGTDSPYAGLPLLDWQFGTAAEVAARLQAEWNQELDPRRNLRLKLHLRASAHVALANGSLVVRWDNSENMPRSGEKSFGTVILAVGFGVERGVLDGQTPSYWRNDSLNQPLPGIPSQRSANYFISGTGDGGLIDLLRVCIDDFNQGRILDELFTPNDPAIVKLRQISEQWYKHSTTERGGPEHKGWLFKQFEEMSKRGHFKKLRRLIRRRRRKDTIAILNGRESTFSRALSLDGASLFNTLLAYQLYQLQAFSYVSGWCERIGESTAQIDTGQFKYEYLVDQLIFRHGPLRTETLTAAGLNDQQVQALKVNAGTIQSPIPDRLWPAGWWQQNRQPTVANTRARVEFVSPVTKVVATTFVQTLAEILIQRDQERRGSRADFRVTLHRIVEIGDEVYYQQMCRYAGAQTEGAVGRVTNIRIGLVGLASWLGEPLIVTKDQDYGEFLTRLTEERRGLAEGEDDANSMLVCPFFAPGQDANQSRSVLLVLYMDSTYIDFFDNPGLLRTIYSACKGFVHNLDEMSQENEVRFVTSNWQGYESTATVAQRDSVFDYRCVADDRGVFETFVTDLTFRSVTSLEMHLRGY